MGLDNVPRLELLAYEGLEASWAGPGNADTLRRCL